MCGICGIVNSEEGTISHSLLSHMCKTLYHRGPDEEGITIRKKAGLGARRLSIIDLERGHQPLSNENGTVWVAHNGEIYNFPSLKRELEAAGHIFRTRTDTETIVHSYEEWGDDFVEKFRGMFAFALWDEKRQRMLLVRDRLGIKPLYYTLTEDKSLIFGSELKSLLLHPGVKRTLNPKALDLFLTLEYIPSPHTIFKDIHKLPPGCYLSYENGCLEIKRYWKLSPSPDTSTEAKERNLSRLKEELYSLLKESVKIRLLSDVPLGAFLSGGIDSSTIVGLMWELGVSPLRTFSVGFEEESYNELKHARRIVEKFKTKHEEFILRPQALELTQRLIRHLDEPFGDFSIFPTYLISKVAREHVKVILSGDGGDEVFAGYEHYQAQKLSRSALLSSFLKGIYPLLQKIPPSSRKKGIWNKLRRLSQGFKNETNLRHFRWMIFFPLKEKENLYSYDFLKEIGEMKEIYEKEPFSSLYQELDKLDEVNAELYLDLNSYLPDDILVKVDRMSMANSLETRVPLLDHKLVEFMFRVPGNLKLKGLTTKWLFKKTMERLLPRENIYRSKEGFSIPIKTWLKLELREFMLDYLNEKRIKEQGLFNFPLIKKMIEHHLAGKENYSHELWSLLVFEVWKENYL